MGSPRWITRRTAVGMRSHLRSGWPGVVYSRAVGATHSVPSCVFCDAQDAHGSSRLENSELLNSEHFVLMPALGPLVPGHVLIVSRDHALSLAALGTSVLTE